MKGDITGKKDIELLVNSFYERVRSDETIGYIFNSIIGDDWSHHLPIMYQFWDTILFQKEGYRGNVIQKHINIDKKIPLQKEHYDQWLLLWNETVDRYFEGLVASEARNRAALMIHLINMKVDWARLDNSIQ